MEGYSLGIFFLLCILQQGTHGQDNTHEAGHHCGNVTVTNRNETHILSTEDHYHCVLCMFPQNCLSDNSCRDGTSGSMCEKCRDGFFRQGNTCIKCPTIPWSTVSFGVYILLFLVSSFYGGFTMSVCTKMKLLCHYLQYILLTVHIKIPWPNLLIHTISYVDFANFNSKILIPECLFPNWYGRITHYLEWLTAFGVVVVMLIFGYFMDRSLKLVNNRTKQTDNHQKSPSRRPALRRLVVMVILVMYMPTTLASVRTFLCSKTVPTELVLDSSNDVFLLDNEVTCDTFVFQTIHFFATLYLLIMVAIFPVLIVFFTLRQRKWNLLYTQWNLYAPIYETYKDGCCFWEAIPLLRKLVGVIVTEAYPFSTLLQTTIQLGLSAFYLLLVFVLRPFRSCYWVHPNMNIHMLFEVISTLAVCVVQGIALSVVLEYYLPVYEIIGVVCVCLVLVLWIVMILALSCETSPDIQIQQVEMSEVNEDGKDSNADEKQATTSKRGFKFWKKPNRVGPDPLFVKKVNENKNRINF